MDTAVFATLKKLIGKKTDSTDETVNGKLNTVINNTSASTSANASGTISQKLSYLIGTLIGSSNATGGSATAGTVMSKLNALLSSWTAARAGYLDNIRSYTITNNSASSTGVLSQKLSYLISQRQASQTGTGTTIFTTSITSPTYSDRYICIAKFVAPVSGIYKVTVTANAQGYSSNIDVKKIITATASYCYNATNTNYSYVGGRTIDQNASYDASSVNSVSYVSKTDSSSLAWSDYISDRGSTLFSLMPSIGTIQTSTSAAVSKTFSMYCTAGEQVQLVEYCSGSRSYYIHSVNVTYQGR
ncbi:hypothetical protein DW773_01885 [Firmicutes bacterium AM29-6AC]|jgi:hypothetical protein|uniref:Uncharacterized protein n=1 Tax=Anaerotignum faecicola TaxID=2358141 RepID=A0A401LDA3_9FIRM|nr:hypothetical protein [Anaerotignum faecicola]RHR16474.1 hypothetical protein DWX47_01455 [Firmicutes bacterium AF19-2LB]RHT42243.1 hypothetical protein DW773_01885 [Firmicutes bacterium AM29-6AC]GCB29520.1 hypothetical protein KGMB03357_11810 [Anaerotignum faecicola]